MISLPPKNKLNRDYFTSLGIILISAIISLAYIRFYKTSQLSGGLDCNHIYSVEIALGKSQILSTDTEHVAACYQFEIESGQTLSITVNTPITLLLPDSNTISIQDVWSQPLTSSGKYLIKVEKNSASGDDFFAELSTWLTTDNDLIRRNGDLPLDDSTISLRQPYSLASGSSQTSTPFINDPKLKEILDQVVVDVEQQGLPIDKLSISLLSVTSDPCCSYAGFNDRYPRYPASVVKLFWLVNLYAQYEDSTLRPNAISESEIHKMIADSDNEPASRALDLITQTESGENLSEDDLKRWLDKRLSINRYFEARGYQGINLSQKVFPIPYLHLNAPQGRELQMRGNETQPIRNHLTTYSTAHLLYEVSTNQILDFAYSQRILDHLKRNLSPSSWQGRPFNSIEGFLGESLPENIGFYSKAGWMSISRNDAAIITTHDGRTKYILVVFGDDKTFMDNEDIFPAISKSIYQSLVSNP